MKKIIFLSVLLALVCASVGFAQSGSTYNAYGCNDGFDPETGIVESGGFDGAGIRDLFYQPGASDCGWTNAVSWDWSVGAYSGSEMANTGVSLAGFASVTCGPSDGYTYLGFGNTYGSPMANQQVTCVRNVEGTYGKFVATGPGSTVYFDYEIFDSVEEEEIPEAGGSMVAMVMLGIVALLIGAVVPKKK